MICLLLLEQKKVQYTLYDSTTSMATSNGARHPTIQIKFWRAIRNIPTSRSSSRLEWDDSDDSLSDSLSLEKAIRKHPRIAIDELASFLGFRFGDIQNSFEREALREQPQQPAIKSTASVAVKVRRNTPWIGTFRPSQNKRVRIPS